MKIAVVVSTYPPYRGGMGNSAADSASVLVTQGHEVTVFTLLCHSERGTSEESGITKSVELDSSPTAQNDKKIGNDKIKVVRLKPMLFFGFKNGGFVPALYKYLKSFDAVYLHYPFFGGAEVVWLYKILHKSLKLVLHFHMDTPKLSGLGKFLSIPSQLIKKSLFNITDRVVCASLDYVSASGIRVFFKKFPEKFIEIPFTVDDKKFHVLPHDIPDLQQLRDKYSIADDSKIVIFVGALDNAHSFKGVDVLLQAVASLSEVKLLIVGDGDLKQNYIDLAKKLNISERVIFTGSLPDEDLVLHYNLADVLVLPSTDSSEAFGIVLLEAMACGLPVIASQLPGVRAVFTNNEEGMLVAPRDEEDLANKLKLFFYNDHSHQRMSNKATALIEKKYNPEVVNEKYKEVF